MTKRRWINFTLSPTNNTSEGTLVIGCPERCSDIDNFHTDGWIKPWVFFNKYGTQTVDGYGRVVSLEPNRWHNIDTMWHRRPPHVPDDRLWLRLTETDDPEQTLKEWLNG